MKFLTLLTIIPGIMAILGCQTTNQRSEASIRQEKTRIKLQNKKIAKFILNKSDVPSVKKLNVDLIRKAGLSFKVIERIINQESVEGLEFDSPGSGFEQNYELINYSLSQMLERIMNNKKATSGLHKMFERMNQFSRDYIEEPDDTTRVGMIFSNPIGLPMDGKEVLLSRFWVGTDESELLLMASAGMDEEEIEKIIKVEPELKLKSMSFSVWKVAMSNESALEVLEKIEFQQIAKPRISILPTP